MSREDALVKLLRCDGPMRLDELILVCGWPIEELRAVIWRVYESGRLTWSNFGGQRHYMAQEPAHA